MRLLVDLNFAGSLDEVAQLCGSDSLINHGWLGCAFKAEEVCTVIALMPTGWTDADRLIVLGHEIMHCIGWVH